MDQLGLILPLGLVLLLSVPLWITLAVVRAPVQPGHLVTFSRRQGLAVTAGNGNHVIAYLGTTRRWRAFGLASGIIASILSDLPNLTISSVPLLAGWFAGALFAELRVLPPPSGARRAALVARRKLSTYLRPSGRALLPGAALLSVPIGLIRPLQTLPWTICAIAVAVAVLLIQRRVLDRPQPAGSADVIAADDAIRSRSLHVLAGGGTALVLLLVLGQLARLDLPIVVGFMAAIAVAIVGWAVATSRWLVVRAA